MITGHIVRQRLNLCDSHVVADTIDYLEAKFIFKTDDWDGLTKWAHFANDGGTVYDIRLTEDCIRKEDHLNLSAGMWKVYLHGNGFRDGEVVQRITTDEAVLYVNPTGTLDGEPFPEMPASVTEQILARLDNVEQNGGGGGGIAQETDPTVPAWAKQPEKPTYTKGEVGLNNVDNVRQYSVENPPPYPVLVLPYGDTTHSFEDLLQKAEQGVLIGVFRDATYTAWLHTYSAYGMTFRTYEGLATRIITYLPDGTWKSERKVSGSVVKEFLYGDAVSYSDIDSAADEYCIFLYVPFSVDGIGSPTAVFAGRERKTKTATFIADIANGKRIICRLTDTVWSYEVEDFSGSSGADGFSPSASVEQTDDGAIVTITDKDGTTTATITNGKDGQPGEKGDPGNDYILTDADRTEIAQKAYDQFPDWAKQPEKPSYTADEVGALPASTKIPEKTSDITNDSGFITNAVTDLANYYTKSQTYTQAEVNALVSAIPKFAISVVTSLPTTGISTTTVYLVKSGTGSDLYTEYIYVNGAWEILGSQRVDLTGYATEAWVNAELADYLPATQLTAAINTALAQAKESGEFDGANGTSVTVTDVQESTEDGGSNVVTFSDGNTLNIKNGSKGSKGDPGPAGATGPTGPAYTLTDSDKSSIATMVKNSLTKETWTFELEDGSTVTKAVYVG